MCSARDVVGDVLQIMEMYLGCNLLTSSQHGRGLQHDKVPFSINRYITASLTSGAVSSLGHPCGNY